MPAFSVIQQPLTIYAAEQALLPTPATSLLDGTRDLLNKLQDVPVRVSDGKGNVISPEICGIFQATAVLPSSRPAFWNGAVPLPMQWSKLMTASSGRYGVKRNVRATLVRMMRRRP